MISSSSSSMVTISAPCFSYSAPKILLSVPWYSSLSIFLFFSATHASHFSFVSCFALSNIVACWFLIFSSSSSNFFEYFFKFFLMSASCALESKLFPLGRHKNWKNRYRVCLYNKRPLNVQMWYPFSIWCTPVTAVVTNLPVGSHSTSVAMKCSHVAIVSISSTLKNSN